MTDTQSADPDATIEHASETPSHWRRLVYMLGFAFLAYLTFWAVLLLSAVQFVYVLLNSERNDELAGFTSNLLLYAGETLGFIAFIRKDRPFPFAPFPKTGETD